MTPREHELAARRAALLQRSQQLRADITQTASNVAARLTGVERIISTVQRVSRAPVLLAGSALFVLMAGPARAMRLASRALVVLGLLRRILSLRDASRP